MKSSRAAWALVTAAVLMTTAACGGSDEGGSSDASGATGGGDGGLTTLTMAETPGSPFAFVSYGVQRGHFEDEGIDLQARVNPGGGTSTVPALVQGDMDVLGLDLVSTLTSIGADLPIRMVAAGSATSEEADGDFAAVLVRADSPIQGPEDFDGIRMGVNALRNVNDLAIGSILEQQGLAPDAISPVELPFPDILAAIDRGDVDAGIVIEPFATIGQNQGLRVVARPWHAIEPGMQIGTMVMTEQTVARVGDDVVAAFSRAVQATADDIREDPDAFRAALPELTELDPALAEQINLIQWRGQNDRESIELTGELMTRYGLLDAEIDYDEVILDD
ncbi:ABC transporter substrate-binding protein [Geodermatophilus sabuli]|uniref:NitT/TauT family transport system substrate-binding protein n=1 Tax=Geodermatophilus sabuli TaxID=1564158 RepID=A0A285EDF7_9ACTN|nr:ABC transporter substrate-binding protein [Geodermatophilus sabuli]MBB3085328.1 NitT/TauT family transport system substrate-binding protein [Geodermatophilus sabuli]SNX96244.1 NitT/TauT family transport system substrate-binding protein [Geodermatophilus sabuli]